MNGTDWLHPREDANPQHQISDTNSGQSAGQTPDSWPEKPSRPPQLTAGRERRSRPLNYQPPVDSSGALPTLTGVPTQPVTHSAHRLRRPRTAGFPLQITFSDVLHRVQPFQALLTALNCSLGTLDRVATVTAVDNSVGIRVRVRTGGCPLRNVPTYTQPGDPRCRSGFACSRPVVTKEARFRAVVVPQQPLRRPRMPVGVTGFWKTAGFGPKTKSPSLPPARVATNTHTHTGTDTDIDIGTDIRLVSAQHTAGRRRCLWSYPLP